MQHDRFAREIVAFLVFSDAARLRRLMRQTLGRHHAVSRMSPVALPKISFYALVSLISELAVGAT